MVLDDQTFISHSHAETQAFGEKLASQLNPGDLLAFYGDLGSGKTCMIQGICRGLKIDDQVTSPTFILINEYEGQCATGPVPIYHFDLYRLTAAELEDLGAEEYFYGRGICLVEWADRATDLLPPQHHQVLLEYLADNQRHITLRRQTP